MKKTFWISLLFAVFPLTAFPSDELTSPTEGVITTDYLGEVRLKGKSLEMLAKLMTYAKNIYIDAGTNSEGTACGYFQANSAGQNNEDGVRTNADFSMICAFLYKYARPAGVVLPEGISYEEIKKMALRSLVWAYSTHRSLQLKTTTNAAYWGSADIDANGDSGGYTWESSLWTESVGYAAWLLDSVLTDTDKLHVKHLIVAEANEELERTIPTNYSGDTKAEENGWDTNVLAIACALYPDHANAQNWYRKMQEFASNCYSMYQDASDTTLVDGVPAKEWYIGQNLYNDYTLQNHNYFHTSYQNVVIEELCESYLALACMQDTTGGGRKFALSENLLWNQKPVFDQVLKELALADGELAMPNGNDWSMFLYDQLPAYTGMATIFRDPDALMLENMALKYIEARQTTTSDGSWMLNSDIGPRRMGVTAHRVMMTWLLHEFFPVADMKPSAWTDFCKQHLTTKYFFSQNVIRGMSKDRFTCFSWSDGLNDYTGIIVPNSPDRNKIMVPFKTHHTGNLLGVYNRSDNTAVLKGQYAMFPNSWAMNGVIKAAGGTIPQSFVLYSTSGNAVILLDALKATSPTTVSVEQGGMMGISVDPFTKEKRTIYYGNGGSIDSIQVDGSTETKFSSFWANIDNQVGFVCKKDNNQMGFADRSLNNSIYTAKIYPSYSTVTSTVDTTMNHIRNFVYYSNISADETRNLANKMIDLTKTSGWIQGWNAVVVPDPDGTYYLLVSKLFDTSSAFPVSLMLPLGAPVFNRVTDISGDMGSASFDCVQNFNVANELKVFVKGDMTTCLKAVQDDENPKAIYLYNTQSTPQSVTVSIIAGGKSHSSEVTVNGQQVKYIGLDADSSVVALTTDSFPGDYRNVAFGTHVYANSQEGDHLPFCVLDNDSTTYYQSLSNASEGTEFLALRLRNAYQIDKVILTPVDGQPAPSSITVQTSMSDGNYVDVSGTVTDQTADGKLVVTFPSVKAAFVKVKLNGGAHRIAVRKLAVYGLPAESSQFPVMVTSVKSVDVNRSPVTEKKVYTLGGIQVSGVTYPGYYVVREKYADGTMKSTTEIRKK